MRAGRGRPRRARVFNPQALVKQFLDIVESDPKTKDWWVTYTAGVPHSYISQLRHGHILNPTVGNLAACAEVLGYELVLVKKESTK